MSGTTPKQTRVVIYDGDCPFCRKQIAKMQTRDDQGLFEFTPRQTPGLDERFPVLATSDFNTGMRLIEPDGTVCVGADAVYGIARHLRGWRRLAWLYRIPGLRGLCRLAYAQVARNRQRLGKTCDDSGACRIEQPPV